MTACAELYKKWKKEPNFCGLGKSEASSVNKYIEFVEDFSKEYGIEESIVYRNAPRTAIKPLLKFKKDSDIRKNAAKKISQVLNDKHAITGTYVGAVIGMIPQPKTFVKSPMVISSEGVTDSFQKSSIKDKVRLITSVLTTGQMNIVIDVMKKQHLDNEYEAISLIIKWAPERNKI